jgi:hypothetical protein
VINYRKLIAPSTMLASCIVGLIISPFIYIGIGALFNFSAAFSLIMLPPLLLASGFLLWRFLNKPRGQGNSMLIFVLEVISWMAIIAFLVFISGYSLLTTFERVGLFCTFFLIATAICLPLMSMRNTSLEQRIKELPKGIVIAALVLVLASSGLLFVAYQMSTPRFI